MRVRLRVPGRVVAFLALALLPGCSSPGGEEGGASSSASTDTVHAPQPASLPSPDSMTDAELGGIERSDVQMVLRWGRSATDRDAPGGRNTTVLRGWQVYGRQQFDRFVLTFADDDPMPGYRVEFTKVPLQDCGSGAPINSQLHSFLSVRITGVRTGDGGDASTFERDTSIRARRNLKELYLTCEDKKGVEFVLGLAGERDYRIMEVANPRRLVVDVHNTVNEN